MHMTANSSNPMHVNDVHCALWSSCACADLRPWTARCSKHTASHKACPALRCGAHPAAKLPTAST